MGNRLSTNTLKHIAEAAGVSVATVSRVLAKAPNFKVSKSTEERIHYLASSMKYVYNASAKSLRTRKTYCLELLIPEIGNPIYAPVVEGATQAAHQNGYQILINTLYRDEDLKLDTWLCEQRVDGILISTTLITKEDIELFERLQYPYEVFFPSLVTSRYVAFDEYEAMSLAVKCLCRLGHTRIAYLAGPLEVNTFEVRFNHFVSMLAENGLAYDPDLCIQGGRSSFKDGDISLQRLADRGLSFTAVICGTINIAVGALHATKRIGLRVPDDISIIGINDSPVTEVTWPPLTVVRTPLQEVGFKAVENILARLSGSRSETPVLVKGCELIPRATTGIVTSGNQ